jgi:hypothetical protein
MHQRPSLLITPLLPLPSLLQLARRLSSTVSNLIMINIINLDRYETDRLACPRILDGTNSAKRPRQTASGQYR